MINSRYSLVLVALVVSCRHTNYVETLKISGKGLNLSLQTKGGKITTGVNEIRIIINPPLKLQKMYFYMPPMPGMPEMRAVVEVKEKGKGIYDGKVSIPMEGSWQIVAEVSGKVVKREIVVPFTAGEETETDDMKQDMHHDTHKPTLTVPSSKLVAFNIKTYKVKVLKVPSVFYAAGVIKYPGKNTFHIIPRFSGYITKVFVDKEGTYVKKGNPLFEFYSPEIVRTFEEYIQAKESSDSISIGIALEKLSLFGVNPEDIKDTVATFRSPVSGRVSRVFTTEGMKFSSETRLYEITGGRLFYFVGEVPQSKARYLSKNSIVEIDGIKTKINEISPSVNPRTRTVGFIAQFYGDPATFHDGMITTAKIVEITEGKFVPKDAVIRTGLKDYVYVRVGKNTFSPVKIKVLYDVEDGYIVEGLDEGMEIVEKGVFFIDAEANLRGIK